MLGVQSHWPWERNLWVNVCTVESQYHLNLTLLHFSRLLYMFKSFLYEVTCPKYTISPPFHPPSHPWFSWPISICLHQSYPLTRGLDSSMPATPRPPRPLPSLHLSLHPCVFTSAIQCCHCTLKWCSTATHASWMWQQTVHVHTERHYTLISLHFMCHKYYHETTILWRTVILPSLVLLRPFFLTFCCSYLSSKDKNYHFYLNTDQILAWCICEWVDRTSFLEAGCLKMTYQLSLSTIHYCKSLDYK